MRALVDTCVIVDALQNREPFCADAQKVFLAVANHWFDGCITAKASADIYYLAHRTTHSDTETRKILSGLFALYDLLDTAPWIAAVPFLPTFRTTRTLSWQKPRCAAVVTAS